MDNYNYYDKKISALEKKIGQLEALNQQVINDNNELKAKLSRERKSTHSIADRSLFPQIDQTIANFLFNYDVDPKTGIINTSASSARKNTNFTNFYRFILQVLKPRGKATRGQKNKFLPTNCNLGELSEKEWSVVVYLLQKITELTAIAKAAFIIIDSNPNEKTFNVRSWFAEENREDALDYIRRYDLSTK